MDRVPEVALDEGVIPTERAAGNVEFQDVWFQYQGRDKVTLECRTDMVERDVVQNILEKFAFFDCFNGRLVAIDTGYAQDVNNFRMKG